jgi:hypothetical protein
MMGAPAKIHVGDVAVIRGEPRDGNPYRGESILGNERAAALYSWRDPLSNNVVWDEEGSRSRHIKPLTDYTFWYAPSFGGAERLKRTDAKRVYGWRVS